MTNSIFDKQNNLKGNWWKKIAIGDSIEGTYERRSTRINNQSKADQTVYEIRTPDGELVLVGGNIGIDSQMKDVLFGQIVGFKYTEDRPSKVAGQFPAKIIQVYANPNIVDEQWIAANKKLKEVEVEEQEVVVYETGDDENSVDNTDSKAKETVELAKDLSEHPFMSEDEKSQLVNQITELAVGKLGASGPEDVKEKVMESTKLAFIESNFVKIAEVLSFLPDRN